MANGEFDGLSVDNLRAMLAAADADKLTAAGTALGDAGPKILDIGSDLRHHVSRVEWTGEGGDAFREWAHDFALEVMRFGLFTTTVGKHVAQAGQTLSETKSALPASRDPRAAHEDAAAQKAASAEAEEARHQLERLSSAYRAAQQTMEAEREPQFKKLPLEDGAIEYERRYDSATAPTMPSDSEVGTNRLSQGQSDEPVAAKSVQTESSHREAPSTHIDSADTLPKPEAKSPPGGPPPLADQPRQTSPSPMPSPPVGLGPGFPRTVTPEGGRSAPRLPLNERGTRVGDETSRRPLTPRGAAERDVVGGQQPRLGSSPRLPRGLVAGEENTPMSRGPMGGSGNFTASPRTSSPNTTGTRQRAVAIGDESGTTARGPVSRVATPGTSGTVSTPSGESGRGRRIASESGGSIAEPRSSSRRGAAFTRGGTGLVRSDQADEQASPRTMTSGTSHRRSDNESGQGLEAQEPWELGRRDTLPPVIE